MRLRSMPVRSKRCSGGIGWAEKNERGEPEFAPLHMNRKMSAGDRASCLFGGGGRSGGAFAFAAFEDLLANLLGGGFDLLHLFANAGAGGLVAAHRLVHIVLGFGHELFERIVL